MKVERMPRPGRGRAPHHRGPGPIAEQDGRGSVLEIGDGGELLGADHQHGLAVPRGDEPLGHGQAVDVAGTGGPDVEGRGAFGADERLEVAGRGGQQPIGAHRGEDDGVEVARPDPGHGHRVAGRLLAQHRDRLVRPWRCGARGCRCARRSTRPTCPARGSGRGWSATPGGTATPTLATSANGRTIMSAPRSRAARTRPRCAR